MAGFPGEVPLVGREQELSQLRDAVTGAIDGSPGAVLVSGEAGVGKTRLVRALLDDLPHPEACVLRAQCVDLGDPGLPYLVLMDLARAIRSVAGADPPVASTLDRLPMVAGLIDPYASRNATTDESDRLRLFDAMAALLADIARLRGPVVVIIEDLQWVDASSSDFLRFLLRRIEPSERLLVLATVRTDGLAGRPGARRLLGELARLPTVRRPDLQPFRLDEVGQYLTRVDDALADPAVIADVLRRTGGNPYFVQALSADLRRNGRVSDGLPQALAGLLAGRLDGLPDEARTVARRTAIAGHHIPDRLLRRVTGLADDVVDQAVRAAIAEGILRPDGAGYSFSHDLLRDAVYDDLLPGDRARLHAAHAAALESGRAGVALPAELAHHYGEAGDSPKVLVWSIRAAEEATRAQAPSEALQHLERALNVWPSVDGAASLTGLSDGGLAIRAARAAGLAGEPARAIDWARRAIRLCDHSGDRVGAVLARAALARQLVAADAVDQAVPLAEEAASLAQDASLAEDGAGKANAAALARVVLARALLAARRTDEARPQSDRALAEARAAGDPGLEVEALTTAAFLDEIGGHPATAADRLRTAVRMARTAGELAAELRAHYQLACLHYYNGDVSGSLPVLATAMTRVTESGLRWTDSGVELRLLHAIAHYVSGDLVGSLAAADAPESKPPDVAAARLAAVSCYPAVALGLPDAAARMARLLGSWSTEPQVALVAGGCEADHLVWEGDFEAAVAIAERAQAHLDEAAGEGMYGGLWLSALALAALAEEAASGRRLRDEARLAAALRRGEVLARRVERIVSGGHGRPGDLGPEGRAWHARAIAEHARLRGEPAVEEWRNALAAFGYGHAYETARCQWRLAEALIAVGDRDAARAHALAAESSARAMRAAPLLRAVEATISGARLAGPAPSSGTVMTVREQEVLALVAEGLTNREIGKRLYISEKTASVHLSNLMAKLNVSSRTEAVTVAQRRGLLDVVRPSRPAR